MTRKSALIVDDEPDIRELLEITLGRMGIDTCATECIGAAKSALRDGHFDFCLTDMKLPDGNGIELVQYITTEHAHMPVAMMTAHGNIELAVEALKSGAFDFVSKPVNLDLLRRLVDTALNLKSIDTAKPDKSLKLVGKTPPMVALRKQIKKLARSQAPIYISGESGSGKELVARLIHDLGPNSDAPFIPVNCGAIPSELMESEFFGHSKGSFSGAVTDKQGLFQAANGGTLFLDEVADLPLAMQVKLLRGIQEKAIRPIGTQSEIPVDVRILSATHKDLAAEVAANNFRQDLYYRINVIELNVPSLRDRSADIPMLAMDLLNRIAKDYQSKPPLVHDDAIATLQAYHFPGNVRELENILERAFTLCEDEIIIVDDLNLANTQLEKLEQSLVQTEPAKNPELLAETSKSSMPTESTSLASFLEDIEKNVIVDALEATRWNRTAAAKKLGITFRALRYKLKKLNLE